jgi:broad specificity phosphatase PhoE
MLACRLHLVRHGHTAGNAARSSAPMSGWADVPLSPLGRWEAHALRRRIAGASFLAVYTSPLQRASETARIAAPGRSIIACDDLREIHCGEPDGLPIAEVKGRYAELWRANLRQDDEDFRWPGGESYRELRARCAAAVRRIAAAHPGGRVLVFTHAGFISQVLGAIHGMSPARWESFRPSNGSITVVDWEGDGGALVQFDDHDHLRCREADEGSSLPGA